MSNVSRRHLLRHLLAALAGAFVVGPRLARADSAKEAGLDAARARLRALAKEKKVSFPFAAPRIEIDKSERRLDLFDGDIHLKRYTVALGLSPEGHKQREGDNRTPEGDYFVCYRNYASAFHLFLGINYPNAADAKAGEERGLVDARTAARIGDAEKKGVRPHWGSPLGGAVGLHGGGTGSDWTWGCIALSDEEMDELWAGCPVGTPVRIRK